MQPGKLSGEELNRFVLDRLKARRPEVLARARLGGDCAAFRAQDVVLVSTDPITGAVKGLGTLAMQVAFNDVCAAGGEPFAATLTILLPPQEQLSTLGQIVDQAEAEAQRLGVEIIGGHTECTDAVTRTVLSVTALGLKKGGELPPCKEGDLIYLVGDVGLEGAAVLSALPAIRAHLTPAERAAADALGGVLGIAQGAAVAYAGGAKAVHDITEGGILGAAYELQAQTGCGVQLHLEALEAPPLCKRIADLAGVDVFRLLSSGAMLVVAEDGARLQAAFQATSLPIRRVGVLLAPGQPGVVTDARGKRPLQPCKDEIYRVFSDGVAPRDDGGNAQGEGHA